MTFNSYFTRTGFDALVNSPRPTRPKPNASIGERIEYNSALHAVSHPRLEAFNSALLVHTMVNSNSYGTARMLSLDGPANCTKTTTALLASRDLVHSLQKAGKAGAAPVVPINIPARPDELSVLNEFFHFFGRHRTRGDRNDAANAVYELLVTHGTRVVILDDVDRMGSSKRMDEGPVAFLKFLADKLQWMTFVLVGRRLRSNAIYAGPDSDQLLWRTSFIDCPPWTKSTASEWKSLIFGLEECFDLRRHDPGTLARDWRHLMQLVDGRFGAIAKSMQIAAVQAVVSGTERITKEDIIRLLPPEDARRRRGR